MGLHSSRWPNSPNTQRTPDTFQIPSFANSLGMLPLSLHALSAQQWCSYRGVFSQCTNSCWCPGPVRSSPSVKRTLEWGSVWVNLIKSGEGQAIPDSAGGSHFRQDGPCCFQLWDPQLALKGPTSQLSPIRFRRHCAKGTPGWDGHPPAPCGMRRFRHWSPPEPDSSSRLVLGPWVSVLISETQC